jgi:hypothetical protein
MAFTQIHRGSFSTPDSWGPISLSKRSDLQINVILGTLPPGYTVSVFISGAIGGAPLAGTGEEILNNSSTFVISGVPAGAVYVRFETYRAAGSGGPSQPRIQGTYTLATQVSRVTVKRPSPGQIPVSTVGPLPG